MGAGSSALFRIVNGFYWLGLGVWLGAMIMLVIAAAITFKTVRAYQPALGAEPYNHPALADRAAPILAGGIVGNVLKGLGVLSVICALTVLTTALIQTALYSQLLSSKAGNLLRLALLAAPMVILLVELLVLEPRVWQHRVVMYDPQQPTQQREAARVEFDRYHKLSERLVGSSAFMLMAAIFVSAWVIHPPAASAVPGSGSPVHDSSISHQ